MYFELFARRNIIGLKRWYWHLKGANHEIICASQAYTRQASAIDACRIILGGISLSTPIRVLW